MTMNRQRSTLDHLRYAQKINLHNQPRPPCMLKQPTKTITAVRTSMLNFVSYWMIRLGLWVITCTRWGGKWFVLVVNLLMLRDPTCQLVLPVVLCSFDSGRNKTMFSYTSLWSVLSCFSLLVCTAVVAWVSCFSLLVHTAVVVWVGCFSMPVVCFCQKHKGSSGLIPRPDHQSRSQAWPLVSFPGLTTSLVPRPDHWSHFGASLIRSDHQSHSWAELLPYLLFCITG